MKMKYTNKVTNLKMVYGILEGKSIEDHLLRKNDTYLDSTIKVIIIINLKDG